VHFYAAQGKNLDAGPMLHFLFFLKFQGRVVPDTRRFGLELVSDLVTPLIKKRWATTTLQKSIRIKMQCYLDAADAAEEEDEEQEDEEQEDEEQEEELNENAGPVPVAAESAGEDEVASVQKYQRCKICKSEKRNAKRAAKKLGKVRTD
jgi:hypothetical protein